MMEARSRLSPSEAAVLAEQLFGLRLANRGGDRELPSYRDQNFLLPLASTGGEAAAVVLKVHHACDSAFPEAIEAQDAAMHLLLAEGVPSVEPLPSRSGRPYEVIEGGHLVRCFKFMPSPVLGKQEMVRGA